MNIGFLSAEQYWGKKPDTIGSSRIRVNRVIKHWGENSGSGPVGDEVDMSHAENYRIGQKYDVVVYQKVYWQAHAENFKGIKILDLCDPDWLEDWDVGITKLLYHIDAVTTSSIPLAEYVARLIPHDIPITVVPDRVDLDEYAKYKKTHIARARTAVWFGYGGNFAVLESAIAALIKHGLSLIVVSDTAYTPPAAYRNKITIRNLPWSPMTADRDIQMADIAINPKLSTGRFLYKSNNKTLTAWALGLPVAENEEQLKSFLEPEARIAEVDKRAKELREFWDVKMSVGEMKDIIRGLRK